MICAMCLVDAGVLETSETGSVSICPRQPLDYCMFMSTATGTTIDYLIGRRGCRDAKAGLRKTTLMSWSTNTQTALTGRPHHSHPNHVVARCIVSSCCSARALKAYLYLKTIGHAITPSFRRNHPPDQSSITRKQLQQMAEHKVCCRRGH
jgi:hypothetical protein